MNFDHHGPDRQAAEPPSLYTKPEWSPPDMDAAAALIERVVLGVFVTAGPRGVAVSHLPFLLERGRGTQGCLVSHLALDTLGYGRSTFIAGPQR